MTILSKKKNNLLYLSHVFFYFWHHLSPKTLGTLRETPSIQEEQVIMTCRYDFQGCWAHTFPILQMVLSSLQGSVTLTTLRKWDHRRLPKGRSCRPRNYVAIYKLNRQTAEKSNSASTLTLGIQTPRETNWLWYSVMATIT